MKSYIRFSPLSTDPKAKTCKWRVTTAEPESVMLGMVSWYTPWRCYAYTPFNDSIYEKVCLREIASFCEAETDRQREAARQQRGSRQ